VNTDKTVWVKEGFNILNGCTSVIGPFVTVNEPNCWLPLSKRSSSLYSHHFTPLIHKIVCLAAFPVFVFACIFHFIHICVTRGALSFQPESYNVCAIDKSQAEQYTRVIIQLKNTYFLPFLKVSKDTAS